jgi:hypothetical protein
MPTGPPVTGRGWPGTGGGGPAGSGGIIKPGVRAWTRACRTAQAAAVAGPFRAAGGGAGAGAR